MPEPTPRTLKDILDDMGKGEPKEPTPKTLKDILDDMEKGEPKELTPRILKEIIDRMDESQLDIGIIIEAEGISAADYAQIQPDGALYIS